MMRTTSTLIALLAVTIGACSENPAVPDTSTGGRYLYHATADTSRALRTLRVSASGGDPTLLADSAAIVSAPAGGRMLLLSRGARALRLHLASASGTTIREIESQESLNGLAALSPDGRTILYTTDGASYDTWSYHVVPSDGTGRVTLTTTGAREGSVAFSSDGGTLAFLEDEGGLQQRLVVVDRDGSNRRVLTDSAYSLGDLFSSLAFSPAGDRIFYLRRRSRAEHFELWSIGLDGTGARAIVNELAIVATPAVSPDGRTVAFSGQTVPSSDGFDLYLVNSDGTSLRRVTDLESSRRVAINPAWAPDGRRIAYIELDESKGSPEGSGTLQTFDVTNGTSAPVAGTSNQVIWAFWGD